MRQKKSFRFLIPCGLVIGWLLAAGLAAEPTVNAIPYFEQGRDAEGAENYYLAVEKYKAALSINPSYLDPVKGLARAFFYLDEYDEALRYIDAGKRLNRNDLELSALEGKIDIVLGKLDAARTLFSSVLAREPNNTDAMNGLALLDIAGGRTRYAAKQFEDALVVNPRDRITLLSLALIYQSLGDTAASNRCIELALAYHSNYYLVHYVAGRAAYLQGDFATGEARLKTALALRGDFIPARLLLGNLLVVTGNYDRAIQVLVPLLKQDAENVPARYLLGLAYWNKKDLGNAINSFEGALSFAPDDEWNRLALEQLGMSDLAQGNPKRQELAGYRYDQGRQFEQRDLLGTALLEYRRALKLAPVYPDARLAFGDIFRKRGFPMKYLKELQIIDSDAQGKAPRNVKDDIEYYTSRAIGTVAERWKLDQHDLKPQSLGFEVFTLAPRASTYHPASAAIIARFFNDVLDGYGKIKIDDDINPEITSFEDAFRTARTKRADYFVILNFEESERTFKAEAALYLARTGTQFSDLVVERTGNDRIRDTLLKLGSSINDMLPIRGILVKKEFDRGVIDLGSLHGLKAKDSLVIVKSGRVSLSRNAVGYAFADSDVVGQINLNEVDEAVSEGTLVKKTFYDYISAGDEVLFMPKTKTNLQDVSTTAPVGSLLKDLVILK